MPAHSSGDSGPAAQIVSQLGGAGNIENLTHCATRLRFQLHDASGIDQAAVEAIPGVMGVVPQSGDRYQVVIGGGVQNVYNDIQALPSMSGGGAPADPEDAASIKAAARAKGPRGKFAWLDSVFEFLSDSFRPILGALLGASLFITFMALMSTLGVIPNWADPRTDLPPSWRFLNLCWQAVFVFLPLYIAYNASKRVGADPWIGFAIMGVVMLPGFTKLADGIDPIEVFGSEVSVVPIFGLPLTVFDYSSQVFPPLLMAALLGPLYKGLKKLIPEDLHLIFVPFLSMLIMIPLTAFLIGPIGVYTGAGLANLLRGINDFSPLIFAIVIPLAYPFMVPLGLHWPINAIMLLNIQTLGYDYIQGPMGAWNFACFGATAGVLYLSIREKDTQMRQTSTGALAAGLLGGISEPSLYGIHLRFKRIYGRMLVGCLVGGVIIGIGGGVKTSAFVFTSLLTIPAFDNIPLYAGAVGAAFLVSMFLVIFSGYRSPEQQAAFEAARVPVADLETAKKGESTEDVIAASAARERESAPRTVEVLSPLEGEIVPLSEVPDAVFSQGIMGPGAAIRPSGTVVYAPGTGTVAVAQATGHAFGLQLDNGLEVLIHVGIDTVELDGKGFDVKVKAGDKVTPDTVLVEFDRDIVEAAGFSLITPVIVLNAGSFASVEAVGLGSGKVGTPILEAVTKAPAPSEV